MMRAAIYFVPAPDSALWAFGRSALAYDSFTGKDCAFADGFHLDPDELVQITAEPRRYGFHGTLKPPFALADGTTRDELDAALETFAAGRSTFVVPEAEIAPLGRFLALVPTAPAPALNRLADDCVTAFERFRAPLTPADRQRRLSRPLTPRQLAYVDRWGYPYVFEEFRFHMTLTGPIADSAIRDSHLKDLRSLYQPAAVSVSVDAIALCVQDDRQSRFRVMRRYALAAAV